MVGLVVILGFVILFLCGLPIAFSLALPAIIYMLFSPLSITAIAHPITFSLDSFPLLALPLFMFAGSLMNLSGVTHYMFNFANLLVSHWRGGLAQVNILASLIFSGTSGSALADVGGLGKMEIKAMSEAGYSVPYSAAITIASATIGPIFPPSIPLIVFGAIGSVSTVELLLAGITPAIVTVVALMIMTNFIARKRNFPYSKKRSSFKEIFIAFKKALPSLLIPFILIFGMLTGIFSPTEAAAVTIFYILFIDIFIYRTFSWRNLLLAAKETVNSISVILFTTAAAALFVRVLTMEKVTQSFTQLLLSISTNPLVLLLIVNILVLFIGCFLTTTSALLLITPLVLPPLVAAGVDPVHVGIIVVFNLMIGLLTPPVGMSLFLISDVAGVKVQDVIKETIPYLIPLFVALLLITYWPQMVLLVPSLIR